MLLVTLQDTSSTPGVTKKAPVAKVPITVFSLRSGDMIRVLLTAVTKYNGEDKVTILLTAHAGEPCNA